MNFLKSLEADVRQQQVKLQLFPYLLEKFKEFNTRYDSRLFEPGILEKEGVFSDEVLRKVILALYFGVEGNQERYLFDQIPVDLFGSIYEQYLWTILSGTEKRVKLESKTGKRKKMGIYYTPAYIVDYIVKNTVREYIKDKTIDEILEVRIVDPACGSGSFLVRAFQEVCNVVEEKLKAGESSKKYRAFEDVKDKLNFVQKITILKNCIFGVDLDEKAVELAHLNLMLATLDGENSSLTFRKLPEMSSNLKNGNSLIDDPRVAGDKAFKWEAQFPEVFAQGGFDVVVGNPPYGADLGEKDRKWLDARYKTKNTDTAVLFMKLATDILHSNGINGFIIPKPFVYSSTWGTIREHLLNGLREIVDCGKVWKEVKLEQVVYSYDKNKNYESYDSCVRAKSNIKNIGKIDKKTFDEFGFLLNGVSEEELKLGQKIRNIGTSLNDFVVNQRGAMFQKEVTSTKSDFKVLGGKQIGKYYIKENVKGYVSKKSIKDGKAYVKENSILVQNLVAHIENPKDHIEIISSLIKSDKESFVILDTVNQLQNKSKLSSELLLSVINSKLISWYAYRFIFGKAIRTMHFDSPVTERIPILKTIDKKTEQKIIFLVDEMLRLQKKLHEGKPAGNEKEGLERQIKNVDYEIDREVYKLYGLTAEEIKIVEESLK